MVVLRLNEMVSDQFFQMQMIQRMITDLFSKEYFNKYVQEIKLYKFVYQS